MRPNRWVADVFPNPLVMPDQNYWLGFLICDGYIQGQDGASKALFLELQERDAATVEEYAEFVKANVRVDRGRARCGKACTKELELLATHGITQRKTGKESWPSSVTHPYAFIRGILDGDGTVGCYNNRVLSFSFVSSMPSWSFLESIGQHLQEALGFNYRVLQFQDNACRLIYSLGYERAKKLYEYLYQGSSESRMYRRRTCFWTFFLGTSPRWVGLLN
jgi:hypothetical protein